MPVALDAGFCFSAGLQLQLQRSHHLRARTIPPRTVRAMPLEGLLSRLDQIGLFISCYQQLVVLTLCTHVKLGVLDFNQSSRRQPLVPNSGKNSRDR